MSAHNLLRCIRNLCYAGLPLERKILFIFDYILTVSLSHSVFVPRDMRAETHLTVKLHPSSEEVHGDEPVYLLLRVRSSTKA
jgi:hypothetical protein